MKIQNKKDKLKEEIIKGIVFQQLSLNPEIKINNPIETISYEQLCNLNKKKIRNIKIRTLSNWLKELIRCYGKVIELYKELTIKTEYWEEKSIVNFDFKSWNKIRKARQRLTIYFNEIAEIRKKIEREMNK